MLKLIDIIKGYSNHFPRLGCHIFSLANRHGITVIPACIPSDVNVEADYPSWVWLVPEWHLLLSIAWAAFQIWHQLGWLCWDSHILIKSELPHHGNSTTSGSFGWLLSTILGHFRWVLYFSCSISVPSSVQIPGGTCHRSNQTSNCTWLNGGFLPSHSSQHVRRHSSSVSYCRRSHQGCIHGLGAPVSVITAFNPLAAQTHIMQTRVPFLSSSLSGSGRGLQALLEKVGSLVYWCANSTPALADFFHTVRVELVCYAVGIYFCAISAFLEPVIARLKIILSSL